MVSPPSSANGPEPFDFSKPFEGVVVCCTSIPPEHRANRVKELGGVHKYDLTPDVTHLIVGDYDTAKYRHVARERPDIKAMAASWISAVRSYWVKDQEFDYNALEAEHQLKPFESSGGLAMSNVPEEQERQKLLICLTGFEEQDRHYIEETVTANGGNYMGDLSRKVTHLIVCKPEGKKYQAAKNWNITTVSIEWLDDSVKRGLILDETCYDPTLPKESRGKGAITRREMKRHSLPGKRPRDGSDAVQQNGPRKLRKSASMRLSSQGNNLMNEILGARQFSAEASTPGLPQEFESVEVRTSVSIPAPKSLPVARASPSLPPPSAEPTQPFGGVFNLCRFMVHGFSEKKHKIIHDYLTSHDGQIASSMSDLASGAHLEPQDQRFLVVPQVSQPDSHPIIPEGVHIVTEFYIERCIHGRRLFHPNDHVLGRPFPRFPVPGFDELTVHSTGFKDEQLNQVEKTIVQLGAKYAERFNAQSSVMVCPSLKDVRTGKLDLALRHKIPVVNAEWLWQCIASGFRVPWDKFVFAEVQHKIAIDVDPELDKQRQKLQRSRSEPVAKKEAKSDLRAPAAKRVPDTTAFSEEAVAGDSVSKEHRAKVAPAIVQQDDSAVDVSNYDTAPTHQAHDSVETGPLSEVGGNALNESLQVSPSKNEARKTLRRFPTGGTIVDSEGLDESDAVSIRDGSAAPEKDTKGPSPSQLERANKQRAEDEKAAERLAMAKQFTSLMDKPLADEASNVPAALTSATKPQRRKREIFGRAISNVSAASSASAESATTASKALRIDSVKSAPGSIDLLDEMLSGDQAQSDKDEESNRPPATQIGYDDPQARKHRAEMMDRIQGKKPVAANQPKPSQDKPKKVPLAEAAAVTTSGRRTRRKGF
ncbi:hypothetical protein PFICI_05289 [Pestalotiopsis fici W106-1]|uniref:BRCT domain-containing protein n=1 Tax=Pestalotiopsis fici (strain W106-1 / CGMCC3.15140) TaxID=1229662 RepID=W3XBE9_PESFW|nr:uncharacterized protein PFICI_05289 [Pestalotiopsis fici W106-1]ETS83413.1 hypothetical protein PFICI_05289 [Pestalotiopsis fici W106-1]